MFRKPTKILKLIRNEGNYSWKIAKKEKTCYSYTTNILKKFKEIELIEYYPNSKDNRIKLFRLTEKGIDIRNRLMRMEELGVK